MKKRGRPRQPINERFWKFVQKDNSGCWIWTGRKTGPKNFLYGSFRVGNVEIRAHRVSYQLLRGSIPVGFMLLHSCHNRLCVNPYHLKIGTHLENMNDRMQTGRTARGERSRSNLTSDQVREIRASNESQETIASRFGVGQSTISRIVLRQVWAHID